MRDTVKFPDEDKLVEVEYARYEVTEESKDFESLSLMTHLPSSEAGEPSWTQIPSRFGAYQRLVQQNYSRGTGMVAGLKHKNHTYILPAPLLQNRRGTKKKKKSQTM